MARNNKVVVKFLADVDGLRKGVDQTNQKLNGFAKSLKLLGVTLAAAFSVDAVANFTKEAIAAASDLEESYSKVGAVFKENADEVKNWAKTSVTQFGLSQQAALEAAGTFGNLFTAFGVAADDAAKMSISLTELATDLASFNNSSVQEAVTALRSGLSGETEPLKRFGVALSQAAIEAEALALGLINSGDALDQASKTQAIYSLVMKQTANAQGDFLRTQDGLANTTRTLEAAIEDAKATIGTGFLDAILEVTDSLGGPNGLADAIADTARDLGDFTIGLGEVTTELIKQADALKDTTDGFFDLARLARTGFAIGTAGISETLISWYEGLRETGKESREVADATAVWDKASRIAAQRIKGQMVPATVALRNEAKNLQDQALATASAIRAMTGAGSTPENARAVRQLDAVGRSVDKTSIYWKNAAADAKDYFDSINTATGSGGGGGGSLKKLEEETVKWAKGTKGAFELVNEGLDNYILSLTNTGKKAVKLTAEQTTAIKDAALDSVQDILDGIQEAEKQMADTYAFIAEQTANFLGPTNVKAVNQAYKAAQSQADTLERAAQRAKEQRIKAQAAGATPEEIKRLADAEAAAIKKAADAAKEVSKGFVGFWEEAQQNVVAYREEVKKLQAEFERDGVITDAEAQILKDIFTLPPDTGTQIIEQLLTDTGKALTANQQTIIEDTRNWMITITDTFAGKNGFPSVGFTTAQNTRDDFIKELTSKQTQKKIRKAVRKAVPEKVKVRVEWEYAPFQPNLPSSARASSARSASVIADIQNYERLNGSKWRQRVR
jgi:hypothetical protein